MRWLSLLVLMACSAPARPPSPVNVGTPVPGKPGAIAVQLGYRGTFFIGPPFSHLPPFTLLEDGTLIGVEDGKPVYTTQLSRGQVAEIVRHVIELGFEKLESRTEHCNKLANGMSECVSDASFTILRVRMPSGQLREVTTYADFSNEPTIHKKIVDYLEHHQHPRTASYRPTVAMMHVQLQENTPPIANCPAIDPALLHREPDDSIWPVELEGRELEAILKLAPANNGHWLACVGKLVFRLTLVPGIPGSEHLDAELELYKRRKSED